MEYALFLQREGIRRGDGVARTKLSIPGRYKGKDGVFEFIKEPNGDINHRFFNVTKE